MFKLWLYCIITFLFNFYFKSFKCDQTEYDLIHSLLRDYDSSIRPSANHNYSVNVTFGLALTQLIDVDERNMIVTTNCWLNQNWIDDKLKWEPEDFDYIKAVHIPAEKIWKPDILLVNNADSWAKTSSISTNAIVKHDGNVTWLSTVIFKSSCSINVRYFPFDEQTCEMTFASWTFDGFFLDININSGEGDVTNYIKNGEWHLVKLIATKYLKNYSCCEEPYPEIVYKLVIRRRPLFYVFNMVFPCLLITLVAFLGFYLPPGSTEKVSIGITTLLSITVFLMLVAESMPPTSEQLPLLGIYYAVTIGIVSLSTATAVITLNINNKGNKGCQVPRIIKIIFFKYLSKVFRTQLSSKKSLKNLDELKVDDNRLDEEFFVNNSTPNLSTNNLNQSNQNRDDDWNEKIINNAPRKFSAPNYKNVINLNNTNFNLNAKRKSSSEVYRTFLDNNRDSDNNRKVPKSSFLKQSNNNENLVLEVNDFKYKTDNSIILKSVPIFRNYESLNSNLELNNQQNSNSNCNSNDHYKSISNTSTLRHNLPHNLNLNSSLYNVQYLNSLQQRMDSPEQFNLLNDDEHLYRVNQKKKDFTLPTTSNRPKAQDTQSNVLIYELERILFKQFNPLILVLMRTINQNEKKVVDKKRQELIQNEWSDVALILDHILCYFFSLLTLTSCLLIFFNSPHFLSEW